MDDIREQSFTKIKKRKVWTKGRKDCIFKIIYPPKDEGIGTLKKGREMWTYIPKINRIIKIPPALMSQPWMGSDFSNNELSKADSIVEDYVQMHFHSVFPFHFQLRLDRNPGSIFRIPQYSGQAEF